MAFKKLWKEFVAKHNISADEAKVIQDAVTETVDLRVDETTKELQLKISGFETENKARLLKEKGYSDRDIKLLNKLVSQEDGETYEAALERIAEEYEIKVEVKADPIKTKPVEIDGAKPPKEEPSKNDKTQDDEDDGESDIIA